MRDSAVPSSGLLPGRSTPAHCGVGLICRLTIFGVTHEDVGEAEQNDPNHATSSDAGLQAGQEFEASRWQYAGEMLVITSRTTANARSTVTESGCDCTASTHGRRCWHMAAFLRMQRAAQLALTPPQPKMTATAYTKALALVDAV